MNFLKLLKYTYTVNYFILPGRAENFQIGVVLSFFAYEARILFFSATPNFGVALKIRSGASEI